MFSLQPIQDPALREYCNNSTRKSIERMVSNPKLERNRKIPYLGLFSMTMVMFYLYTFK